MFHNKKVKVLVDVNDIRMENLIDLNLPIYSRQAVYSSVAGNLNIEEKVSNKNTEDFNNHLRIQIVNLGSKHIDKEIAKRMKVGKVLVFFVILICDVRNVEISLVKEDMF